LQHSFIWHGGKYKFPVSGAKFQVCAAALAIDRSREIFEWVLEYFRATSFEHVRMIPRPGFTLVELLVMIAVLAVLAVLLFPTIGGAGGKAARTICGHNLHQINFGLRMYADDSTDKSPRTAEAGSPGLNWSGYKELMRNYIGFNGSPLPADKVFACPADTFHYDTARKFAYVSRGMHEETPDNMSYGFNGGNARTNANAPGIAGRTLSSIRKPVKTVLIAESSAFIPYSWHAPKRPALDGAPMFNDAKDMVSFVDGHVRYLKMFWGGDNPPDSPGLPHDPPAGYAYQWSGD
jgi:prepilin-type N-terminal cleavage/methylation domain-containing protein